ncbi:general substrate transporter [Plectosphaerella cucumerina]|uniref:General substrate transporter n=1 Tax=Plectosphaerella cucumerina TaxID=40658 RepID=A0A8K0X700_9PEZI|nr:general substrate transporter [Plectosphaerella cucumerina]
MFRAAESAALREKDMTIMEAIKAYPKAIAFSMILSLCLVMEGYDTALTDAFFSLPQFRERFGERLDNGDYQITAPWMSGLKNGVQVGQILGLMAAGIIAERYGYKKTIVGALIMLTGFIFIFFFATHIAMLFAAGVLCGLPWGAFQTLTTTYAADVTPVPLRPVLTTFVNMCWVMGQLISSGVLRALIDRDDNWAWRIPYAIQWVFPPPIIIGVLLAPESPTWLVRKGRLEEARKALRSLASGPTDEEINNTVAMLAYTDHMEKESVEGVSYNDCFRGTNLRRTEIAAMVWSIQVLCGVWFGGNVIYFLQQAGFNPARSFDVGIGTGVLALAGTVGAWFLLPHIGRRKLYLLGLCGMLTILLTVGFMGIPAKAESIGWASGALMMVFVLIYDLTVGPVCYCLVAEIPSTRLRIKTAVLARNTYNVVSILANFLNPPILNPGAWNLRGKGGFVWAGPCALSLLWTYFRLPETKGRVMSELDALFERGVSARKFASQEIEVFQQVHDQKLGDVNA